MTTLWVSTVPLTFLPGPECPLEKRVGRDRQGCQEKDEGGQSEPCQDLSCRPEAMLSGPSLTDTSLKHTGPRSTKSHGLYGPRESSRGSSRLILFIWLLIIWPINDAFLPRSEAGVTLVFFVIVSC